MRVGSWYKVRFLCWMFVAAALTPTVSSSAAAGTLENIIKDGEIVVGVSEFVPWAMRDFNSDLVGFEIDLAKRLAADIGVEVRFEVMPFADLIPALLDKDVDVIISGMSITTERAKQVNFSTPYENLGISLVVNKQLTSGFDGTDNLNADGVTLAVVRGTTSVELAKRAFPAAAITEFDVIDSAYQALLDGDAHAVIIDEPSPQFFALQYPGEVEVPVSKPLVAGAQAFAIRKGDADFLNYLNSWIIARTVDTWLPSTREYWFESLRWQELVAQ